MSAAENGRDVPGPDTARAPVLNPRTRVASAWRDAVASLLALRRELLLARPLLAPSWAECAAEDVGRRLFELDGLRDELRNLDAAWADALNVGKVWP